MADDEVSRRHARLRVQAAGVQIEDLASANGTFVNGVRVASAALRPGDVTQAGGTALQLREHPDPSAGR